MERFVNFDNDFQTEVKLFLQSYYDDELTNDERDEYLDELIAHPECNIDK